MWKEFRVSTRRSFPVFWKKILLGAVLLTLFTSSPGRAEAPLSLSLGEALRMASERHIQVLLAQERVQQALARIGQSRSRLFPQLQGTAYQYRRTFNLESIGIDNLPVPGFDPLVGPFNTFDARASLTQMLFDAPALSRLKSARLGHLLSQADLKKVGQDAMALVANLFLEARLAQERVPRLRTLLSRDELNDRLARERLSLGLGSELEVSQARAAREQSRLQVTSAETEALERRLDLAAALGLPQDRPIDFVLEEKIDRQPLPSSTELPPLVAGHPEIESARRLIAQREQERKTEVAEFYPKLSGNADIGTNGEHPGNAVATYNFGGQMTIPIYQGGLQKARIAEASSRLKESEAQLEDTTRLQEAKAAQALAALRLSLEAWRTADTNLAFANRQFSLAQTRLNTGLGSRYEVAQAQAERASALDEKSEALATYYQAKVNFAHAVGTLNTWIENGDAP
jgi:outer membrane protein TolC